MDSSSPQAQLRLTSSWRGWSVGFCALVGFVIWQFWGNAVRGYIDTSSVFWWWGWQWFNPASESQHGPVILALAGWVFWRNLRSSDFGMKKGADSPGPAVVAMAAGLGLHVLGYAVQQTRISIGALLLFTVGLLWLAGGRRWARAGVFPLALLGFAIPMGALDAVGFHLRVVVIGTTEVLANALGIEVVRNGTQLFSPDGSYQYDVAAACSGVRSLMALLALSALVGYLGLRSNLRRAGVFCLALPLTVVGNVVRISSIILAGEWLGQGAGVWVHEWAGFVVFLVVLGGVQLAVSWLAQGESELAPRESVGLAGDDRWARHGARVGGVVMGGVAVMAAVTVLLIGRLEALSVKARAGVPLAADGINPAELPVFLGSDWIGQAEAISAVERELLPEDTGYARKTYVSLDDRTRQVFVSVVLSGQDRTSIHRPELCLVGQGWSIVGQTEGAIARGNGRSVPATWLRLRREVVDARGVRQEVPALFAYWFVGREQIVASTGARLWQTALNRLRLQPDRWAYVVVQSVVWPDESEAMVQGRMRGVVAALESQLIPVGKKLVTEKD